MFIMLIFNSPSASRVPFPALTIGGRFWLNFVVLPVAATAMEMLGTGHNSESLCVAGICDWHATQRWKRGLRKLSVLWQFSHEVPNEPWCTSSFAWQAMQVFGAFTRAVVRVLWQAWQVIDLWAPVNS